MHVYKFFLTYMRIYHIMHDMTTKAIVITHRSALEFFDLYSEYQETHRPWNPTKSRKVLESFGYDASTIGRLRPLRLPKPVEILVPSAKGRRPTDEVVFRARSAPLLLGDLVQVGEGIYVCVPELALSMVAGHLSRPRTALLIDQLVSSYRSVRKTAISSYENAYPFSHIHTLSTDGGGTRLAATVYGLKPQTTLKRLARYAGLRSGDFGTKRLREALPLCSESLRSPLEAQDHLLLFAPRGLGGFGLARPVVNREIRLSAAARKIIDRETLKPDFLWPSEHVAVEVLGKADHEGSGARIADTSQRERVWRTMGYTVITHTSAEIHDARQLSTCARELAKCLGQRLRTDSPTNYDLRQAWLRQEVLGPAHELAGSIRSYRALLADAEMAWVAARY